MSNKIKNLIKAVPYIFQTVYFNFHHLPFKQAIFLPIILYKPQLVSTKGKIIIEVIEATVLDDDGNACDDFGFYVKYDSGKYEKGDRVQTAFVYNPENNYLDDILYEVDTLI